MVRRLGDCVGDVVDGAARQLAEGLGAGQVAVVDDEPAARRWSFPVSLAHQLRRGGWWSTWRSPLLPTPSCGAEQDTARQLQFAEVFVALGLK